MNLPRTRRLQRFVSWIASFAILLGVLAPTLSQAGVALGLTSPEWVEICSAQGTRWINVADETSDEPSGTIATEVCAYCFTHAGSFGLTPTGTVCLVCQDLDFPRIFPGFDDDVFPAAIWSPYLTRAPPLSA